MMHLSDQNSIVLNVFLDPINLYLETKIIVLSETVLVLDLQYCEYIMAILAAILAFTHNAHV